MNGKLKPYLIKTDCVRFFLYHQGYRLDFNGFSKFWQGCPSTVVPEAEEHVWGAVWRLNVTDLDNLDRQEGVPTKYLPFNPQIVMLDGQIITCRCYLMVNQPTKQVPLPLERRPSIAYIETILHGAKESELPEDYLKVLNNIPHNNNIGPDMPWLKQLPTTEL